MELARREPQCRMLNRTADWCPLGMLLPALRKNAVRQEDLCDVDDPDKFIPPGISVISRGLFGIRESHFSVPVSIVSVAQSGEPTPTSANIRYTIKAPDPSIVDYFQVLSLPRSRFQGHHLRHVLAAPSPTPPPSFF